MNSMKDRAEQYERAAREVESTNEWQQTHPVDACIGECAGHCPVETNKDVEDVFDRDALAQQLRDCIEAHFFCPGDLNQYSDEMRDVARTLAPMIQATAELRAGGMEALDELVECTNAGLDYLEMCSLLENVEVIIIDPTVLLGKVISE